MRRGTVAVADLLPRLPPFSDLTGEQLAVISYSGGDMAAAPERAGAWTVPVTPATSGGRGALPAVCRQGTCGSCRATVATGAYALGTHSAQALAPDRQEHVRDLRMAPGPGPARRGRHARRAGRRRVAYRDGAAGRVCVRANAAGRRGGERGGRGRRAAGSCVPGAVPADVGRADHGEAPPR